MRHFPRTILLPLLFSGLASLSLLFAACAGKFASSSSAESQVSIAASDAELGENGISISSPNTQGLVTVTGAGDENPVPAGATVIADVNAAAASLSGELRRGLALGFRSGWRQLVPDARAETCASELPVCPDVDADEKCQYTADENGDFSLQIPADIGDTVSLSYLDPTSCDEIEVFDGDFTIDDDAPAVNFSATQMAYDERTGYLFLINGDEDEGDPEVDPLGQVLVFDVDANEEIERFETAAPVTDVAIVSSGETNFLFVSGTERSKMTSIETDGSPLDSSNDMDLVDSNQQFYADIDFLDSADIPSDVLTPCADFGNDLSIPITYTRAYFNAGDQILFFEFADHDYRHGDNNNTASDGSYVIPFAASFFIDQTGYSVVDIPFLHHDNEDGLEIIAGLSNGNAPVFYYFNIDLAGANICNGAVTLTLAEGTAIGTHEADMQFSYVTENASAFTESPSGPVAFLPEAAPQSLLMFDRGNPNDYFRMEYTAGSAFHSYFYQDGLFSGEALDLLVETHLTQDLALVQTVEYGANDFEIFAVAKNAEGSQFIYNARNGDASVLDPGEPLNALHPQDMTYDTGNNRVILIDRSSGTMESDEQTFIRIYELATP